MKYLKSFEQVTLPKNLTALSSDNTSVDRTNVKTQFLGKGNDFWDDAIDFFLPGTPVQDGYDILNKFNDIIYRRIKHNRKKGLPDDTMTDEEIKWRTRLLNSTPFYGYPNLLGLLEIVEDIKNGTDVYEKEFQRYKDLGKTKKFFGIPYASGEKQWTEQELKQMMDERKELKKMWFGLDTKEDDTTGRWVISKFRPSSSKDKKAVYYQPNPLPKLDLKKFDELYNVILKTKQSDGKFPGGNSAQINEELNIRDDDRWKELKLSFRDLGNFTYGCGIEGNKKFISIYDLWDLAPKSLKDMGIDVQKFGKSPEIYFRIYRP